MTPDLGRRIAFTSGALLVYRLGTHIPLPGMSAPAWASLYRSTGGGVLAMFSTLSGGAAGRLAIFALGIVPYFSAAFLLQVVMIFSARFKAFAWRGYAGRNAIVRYTRYLAVVLAAFQAYGIAVAFEAVPSLVSDPGPLFRISTVVTLTGGTVFLIWLSDQITQRGIGNGLALILFVGIALEFPSAVASTLELGRPGALAPKMIVAWGLIVIGLIALIAFVERARRHVPLSYAAAPADGYAVTGRAVLRLKLNNAGLMPSLLASWLITTTITGSFLIVGAQTEWWNAVAGALLPGRPWFMLVYGALIVICTFVYTAFVLDPDEAAADLRKQGGAVDGLHPGEQTAQHLDSLVSRMTVAGTLYLLFVCLVPEFLVGYAGLPFYLGGTSLLIAVCTVLDIQDQVRDTPFDREQEADPDGLAGAPIKI
jgi:preprotein translocase subunit SecY